MSKPENSETISPLIPFVLVALSIAVVLIWQVNLISQERTNLQNAVQQLQQPAKQSQDLQASLQRLVVDLLELAKTDEQAKAVVDKHGIVQNSPAK